MNFTLENLVELNSISKDGARVLEEIVKKRKNILIIGSAGSGKTTLVKAVLNKVLGSNGFVAVVRGSKIEYSDLKPHAEFFDSIDDVVDKQGSFDYIIIDGHYNIDFAHLKRLEVPKIVLIQNKRIDSRLHYLAKDLIDVVIRMMVRFRRYTLADPVNNGLIHSVDVIKIYDPFSGIYTPVYYWSDDGGSVEWEKVKRLLDK